MAFEVLICLILFIISFCTTIEFKINPNLTLPTARWYCPYATYNNDLYIAGGNSETGSAISNIITTNIDPSSPNYGNWSITPYTIATTIKCQPQCGAILSNQKMYIIGRYMQLGNGESFFQYYRSYEIDLNTLILEEKSWGDFTNVSGGCITSNKLDKLYVLGGYLSLYNPHNYLQIYDSNTDGWIQKTISFSFLQNSCQYMNGYIYIFQKVIRKINVESISGPSVSETIIGFINETTAPIDQYDGERMGTFAIDYELDNKLYFGGGYISDYYDTGNIDKQLQEMFEIDAITDIITYLGAESDLLYNILSPAAVYIHNNVLHVLGGRDIDVGTLDLEQAAVLPTPPTTSSPTIFPTKIPSHSPSKTPSKDPSKYPSEGPSNYPSEAPSNYPSEAPSKYPSITPSNDPSMDPSSSPSKVPSVSPSKDPSVTPSSYPSTAPTNSSAAPSLDPSVAPSIYPSATPTNPSSTPSHYPSLFPSIDPSVAPSNDPSNVPSNYPSTVSNYPSTSPSNDPSVAPSRNPTEISKVGIIIKVGEICPNGYHSYSVGFCQRCGTTESGILGECEICGDGKQPNGNNTECVLCGAEIVGVGGYCDVDCRDRDKVANGLHTECIEAQEKESWYETSEFDATMTIIGTLSGLSCIGAFIWVKFRKKLCFRETQETHNVQLTYTM